MDGEYQMFRSDEARHATQKKKNTYKHKNRNASYGKIGVFALNFNKNKTDNAINDVITPTAISECVCFIRSYI